MAMRFRRSIKLAPGIRVNFNKNSVGLTVGPKGAHVSVNSKGQKTESVGIPGTGLSYVERENSAASRSAVSKPQRSPQQSQSQPQQPQPQPQPISAQMAEKYVETVNIAGKNIRYANMQIELPEDMIREFEKLCLQNGDHKEQIVGDAVEDYLEKHRQQR